MTAASRMVTGAVAFVDTETTGLSPYDEVWEFAAIRREPDGSETTLHIQIEHDRSKTADLPERFLRDYSARYKPETALSTDHAAREIRRFLVPSGNRKDGTLQKVHIVGVNPAFDAGMLERLLDKQDLFAPWHYHLVDLSAVTVGVLLAAGEHIELPWRSDDLSARVGVPTTDADGYALYDRHTAMGDVLWVRDWFDALSPPRPSEGTATTYQCRDCGGQWTWRNTADGARGLAETQALHGGQLFPTDAESAR